MAYEPILFCSRGEKKVTSVYIDVISANPAAELHAAEKPVSVITDLLRRSCVPGDRVLDPCAGSGTIFPAAKGLSVFATGMESVEKHYNTALIRMNGGEHE
jgi:DNA modification methylase